MITKPYVAKEFPLNTENFNIESNNVEDNLEKIKTLDVEFFSLEVRAKSPKKFTIEYVQDMHQKIMVIFTKSMEIIQNIKLQLNKNYKENLTMLTIGVEEHLQNCLRDGNNTLLTYRPTAKIEYGVPCIESVITESSEEKTAELLKKYKGIRKIRGDGNCFLSSFTTRFLENYIKESKLPDLIQFVNEHKLEESTLKNIPLFTETFIPLKEEVLKTLNFLSENSSKLEDVLTDNEKILPLIKYFRILSAEELIKNQDQYEMTLRSDIEDIFKEKQEEKKYEELISEYVLKMGSDFSHPSILALCQRLGFCVNIIDPQIGAENGLNILDKEVPKATFCRDGDHYFVLYKEEEMNEVQQAPISNSNNLNPSTEFFMECSLPAGSNLYIRGIDNWSKGIELKNVYGNVWMFSSDNPFKNGECKFLINDDINFWENWNGNRKIINGKLENPTPPTFEKLPSGYETQEICMKSTFDENKYTLGICGHGIDGIKDWDEKNPIFLIKENGFWNTKIQKKEGSDSIGFKYVLINKQSRQIEIWEKGPNRGPIDTNPPQF